MALFQVDTSAKVHIFCNTYQSTCIILCEIDWMYKKMLYFAMLKVWEKFPAFIWNLN